MRSLLMCLAISLSLITGLQGCTVIEDPEVIEEPSETVVSDLKKGQKAFMVNVGRQRSRRVLYERSMATQVLFTQFGVTPVYKERYPKKPCTIYAGGSIVEEHHNADGVVVMYFRVEDGGDNECGNGGKVVMTGEQFQSVTHQYQEEVQRLEPSVSGSEGSTGEPFPEPLAVPPQKEGVE